MRKRLFALCTGALCICACTQVLSDAPGNNLNENVSVPLSMEKLQELESKNYLAEFSSYWTFQMEDGEKFDYFKYKRGKFVEHGVTTATLGKKTTFINFNSADLKLNDQIFVAIRQNDFDDYLNYFEGITNEDPKNFLFSIPEYQVTTIDTPTLTESFDYSFTVSNVRLGETEIKKETFFTYDVVPENSLSLKIEDYNPSLTYKCKSVPEGLVDEDLEIDSNGNVTIPVSFNNFTTTSKKSTTKVIVYVADHSEYENSATVEITSTRQKSIYFFTYNYTISKPYYISDLVQVEIPDGEERMIPLRDAMPCVTKGMYITQYMLDSPANTGKSLSIYMLGSVLEFRLYSLTSEYLDNEKILNVKFTATSDCGGRYTYDLTSEDLTLTPVEGYGIKTITSDVSECDIDVPSAKANAVCIYLVLAPGTYSGTMEIETTNWIHRYQLSNKEFPRAFKTYYYMNLGSTAMTHTRKGAEPEPEVDPNTTGDSSVGINNWTENNDGYEL